MDDFDFQAFLAGRQFAELDEIIAIWRRRFERLNAMQHEDVQRLINMRVTMQMRLFALETSVTLIREDEKRRAANN